MTDDLHFTRRALCASGGSFLMLGLAGCGSDNSGSYSGGSSQNDAFPGAKAIAGGLASIVLSRYFGPIGGTLGRHAVDLVWDGLFKAEDSTGAEGQRLSNPGIRTYRKLKASSGGQKLVYDVSIPPFSATIRNDTDSFINVGEVSCVMYSDDGRLLQRIVAEEFVNLRPGQSTTMSQRFRFRGLPKATIGNVRLEARDGFGIARSDPLVALVSRSELV